MFPETSLCYIRWLSCSLCNVYCIVSFRNTSLRRGPKRWTMLSSINVIAVHTCSIWPTTSNLLHQTSNPRPFYPFSTATTHRFILVITRRDWRFKAMHCLGAFYWDIAVHGCIRQRLCRKIVVSGCTVDAKVLMRLCLSLWEILTWWMWTFWRHWHSLTQTLESYPRTCRWLEGSCQLQNNRASTWRLRICLIAINLYQ